MGEYKKSCYKCNRDIIMSDRNLGKWLPFEADGPVHYCPDLKKSNRAKPSGSSVNSGSISQEQPQKLTLEDLDLRMKMIESIVLDPRPEVRRK